MKKKLVIVALILSVVTGITVGCSSAPSSTESNKKAASSASASADIFSGKTLVVSAQSWIIDKWPLKEAAQKFMDTHPGVKVEVKPAANKGEADSYLLQWSRGKSNVDLALGGSPADISAYVAKEFLVEFDDKFFSNTSRDKFVAPLLDQGKFEGKQYAIPLLGETVRLVVNNDHMKEAGLLDANGKPLVPKDWNELYTFAKKMSKNENGKTTRYGLAIDLANNFINLNYYSGLIATNNGKFLMDDNKTIDFTSEQAKDLLGFWQRAVKDGYTPSEGLVDANSGRNMFKAGGASMLWTASSRAQESEAVLGKGKVSTISLPGLEENGSIVFTHGIYIPKYSDNVELAKVFIQEQLLQEYGQKWSAEKYGKLPVMKEYYSTLPQGLKEMLTIMNNSHSEPLYQEQAKITDLMNREISKMLTTGQSVDETSKNLSNGFKQLNVNVIK